MNHAHNPLPEGAKKLAQDVSPGYTAQTTGLAPEGRQNPAAIFDGAQVVRRGRVPQVSILRPGIQATPPHQPSNNFLGSEKPVT